MKNLKSLIFATGLTFGLATQAHGEPTTITFENHDFTEQPQQAPQMREEALAPLLKVLDGRWIRPATASASEKWMIGSIMETATVEFTKSLDIMIATLKLKVSPAMSAEGREALAQLEGARDILNEGLKLADPRENNVQLHSALSQAKDKIAAIEIRSPQVSDQFNLASLQVERDVLNSLRSIKTSDAMLPRPRIVSTKYNNLYRLDPNPKLGLNGSPEEYFDAIDAKIMLWKSTQDLASDLNRRVAKRLASRTSEAVKVFLGKLKADLDGTFAQLKVQYEKIVTALKSLANNGIESAKVRLERFTSRGGRNANQCEALFKD